MRSVERTLWICCDDEQAIRDSLALLHDVSRKYSRLTLLFTARDRCRHDWLAAEFPGSVVVAAPLEMAPFPSLFLSRWRVQGVLLLTSPQFVGGAVRGAIRRANIPMVISHGDVTAGDRERYPSLEPIGALPDILKRDPKRRRDQSSRFGSRVVRAVQRSTLGQALVQSRAHRIDDFDALRAELGNPGTILCLGNGPSSENSQLLQVGYDCLFRVNWEWKKRCFLTHASVVFTGNARTTREIPSAVFCFQSVAAEREVLTRTLGSRLFSPLRYVTLERLPSFFNDVAWGAKPTNGAAMLAVAVALRPKRLIIAGIDLYAHPAGAYPGAPHKPNAYHPAHSAEIELRIIERALADFEGETVILSSVLSAQLEARRAGGASGSQR